jgi:hypothetical protein
MPKLWLTRRPGHHKITAVEAESRDDAKAKIQSITGESQYTTAINGYEEAPPDVVDYLETEHLVEYFEVPIRNSHDKATYWRHKVPGGWVYIYLDAESGMPVSTQFVPLPAVMYEKL